MQWHWGNIGAAIGGVAGGMSALAIAAATLKNGPAALRAWKARQEAQAAEALQRYETVRLERERHLHGWSQDGTDIYGVTLITDPGELKRAAAGLSDRRGLFDEPRSPYVLLRVTETGPYSDDFERARGLRQLIQEEGYISRAPTLAEREALEAHIKANGGDPGRRVNIGPPWPSQSVPGQTRQS